MWRRSSMEYGAALAAVALVSLFIGLVLGQVNLANVSMLYLLAVLATAVAFGRGPAIFAAVVSFVVFDWFFVEPLHQLSVSNPGEWVSLLFFLLTATVTGQLTAAQRQRAQEAKQREREAIVLYDVVRLLGETELEDALRAVAERLRRELQPAALAIELWRPDGELMRIGAGEAEALRGLQAGASTAAHVLHSSSPGRGTGRWVRIVQSTRTSSLRATPSGPRDDVHLVPIKVADRRVGALLLARPATEFHAVEDRLLSAAAAQIGLALERDRLRKESTEAEILRRTDQLRVALLNAVSHDLRTPLATIMASAGSLRQEDVEWTDDERLAFAQAIEDEAEHLNRLVGNLLDLSRIEAGSLRPEKSWYDLATLISDVLDRLRPVTRNHRLRLTVPDDLPAILLDPVEVGAVLYNLIENAAKYAPTGTDIAIGARRDGPTVSVSVEDRGAGIPGPALPHLFDPFYRVIDGKPRAQGLGLGLAIVKGLVEAHDGHVRAENREGGGARFVFTLPVGERSPAAVESSVA